MGDAPDEADEQFIVAEDETIKETLQHLRRTKHPLTNLRICREIDKPEKEYLQCRVCGRKTRTTALHRTQGNFVRDHAHCGQAIRGCCHPVVQSRCLITSSARTSRSEGCRRKAWECQRCGAHTTGSKSDFIRRHQDCRPEGVGRISILGRKRIQEEAGIVWSELPVARQRRLSAIWRA